MCVSSVEKKENRERERSTCEEVGVVWLLFLFVYMYASCEGLTID